MTGIQFVTDEKGRKVAVQIDLKKYGTVLGDVGGGPRRIWCRAAGCVNNYTVEVKPPARKELEALPDNVLSRVVHKL